MATTKREELCKSWEQWKLGVACNLAGGFPASVPRTLQTTICSFLRHVTSSLSQDLNRNLSLSNKNLFYIPEALHTSQLRGGRSCCFFSHKLANTVTMLQGHSKVPLSGHLPSLARQRGGRKCFKFNINYESRTSDFSFHFLTPMLYVWSKALASYVSRDF